MASSLGARAAAGVSPAVLRGASVAVVGKHWLPATTGGCAAFGSRWNPWGRVGTCSVPRAPSGGASGGFLVESCQPSDGGTQLEVKFSDGSGYELHAPWLRDSSPSLRGPDFYRLSAKDVWNLDSFRALEAEVIRGGRELRVTFRSGAGELHEDVFDARWLRALAPFVGRAAEGPHAAGHPAAPYPVRGSSSLLAELRRQRSPWGPGLRVPTFDAAELAKSLDLQVQFLEATVAPGVALIMGAGRPEGHGREALGKPLVGLSFKVVGTRLDQHPYWRTTFDVSVQHNARDEQQTAAPMRTHGAAEDGVGYLRWDYQAEGRTRCQLVDGVALEQHMREHHPAEHKLLSTTAVTHCRHLPAPAPANQAELRLLHHHPLKPLASEAVATRPPIMLDCDGQLQRVTFDDGRRAACALPFDEQLAFHRAYEVWAVLCEDESFHLPIEVHEGTVLVVNTWRTMVGRRTLAPACSTGRTAWGYSGRVTVENRYRLLRQFQAERANPDMTSKWTTRLPNQVLSRMLGGK